MGAFSFSLPLILLFHFGIAITVKTRYGEIEGFAHQMKNGEEANIFLGVPYASPPIGDLRLEVSW